MAAPANAKMYHEQVRNLFSKGGASATNSPLAYLEKTSTVTEQLLIEQAAANDNILKALREQSKQLRNLHKNTKDSLTFTDLILSRYVAKFLGGSVAAIGAAGAGVLGLGGTALRGGVNVLRAGLPAIFAKFGTTVLGRVKDFLALGLSSLGRVGRPMLSFVQKMEGLLTTGGVLKHFVDIGARIGKLGSLAVRGLSKLAWPITALLGVIDGIVGFMNTDKILGRKTGIWTKWRTMQTEVINGFFLGLPDYISKKLSGEGFSKMVDTQIRKVNDKFQAYTSKFRMNFNYSMQTASDRLKAMWAKLPNKEVFAKFGDEIRTTIMEVGASIKSGFHDLFTNIKGWINDALTWRPSWFPKGSYNEREQGRGQPLPAPRTNRLPPVVTTDKRGRVSRWDGVDQRMYPGGNRAAPPTITLQQLLRAPDVYTTPTQDSEKDDFYWRDQGPMRRYRNRMPREMREIIDLGTDSMTRYGKTMVIAQNKAVQDTMETVGEESAEGLVDRVSAEFAKFFSKSSVITDIFGKFPQMMAQQFGRIFTGENASVLRDIVSGKHAGGNVGEMIRRMQEGAPIANTGVPRVGPGTPGPDPINIPEIKPLPKKPGGMVGPRVGNTLSDLPPDRARDIATGAGLGPWAQPAKPKQAAKAGDTSGDFSQVVAAGKGWTRVKLGDGRVVTRRGRRNWRNNNPGNLVYGDFAKRHGAIGSDGQFAVFPNLESGNNARRKLLFEGSSYKDLSLRQAINRYAPPHENDTSAYINYIQRKTGVDPSGTMSGFNKEQQDAILRAMRIHEGWKEGRTVDESGSDIDLSTTKTPDAAYSNVPTVGYESIVSQEQSRLAGIRRLPLQEDLAREMAITMMQVYGPGHRAVTFSGGQAKRGTKGPRTGSRRHDLGGASDTYIYGPDGKMISQVEYAKFAQAWLAANKGSIGLQMSGGGMHIDKHKKETLNPTKEAPFWTYGKLSRGARNLANKGLAGEHPEYVMSREEAIKRLQDSSLPIEMQAPSLYDGPMFRAGKSPRARKQTPTSSTLFGDRANSALRSRAGMRELLNSQAVGPYGRLVGTAGPVVPNKVSTVADQNAIKPRAPTVTDKSPSSENKMPMQSKDPNLNTSMPSMPSIEDIKVVDELTMLVNSEMVN